MKKFILAFLFLFLFSVAITQVNADEIEMNEATENSNTTVSSNNPEFTSGNCSELREILDPLWLWIRILAPIIVIVMGGFDFFKAVTAGEEKDMKNAMNNFIKRLIILAVILILPIIINIIIGIAAFSDFRACTDFISPNPRNRENQTWDVPEDLRNYGIE